MGIDVFAEWPGKGAGQSDDSSSSTDGARGILHEAYHNGPCATMCLVTEALQFETAVIPATVLRPRLPRTLDVVEEIERTIYQSDDAAIERFKQEYRDFVALCERKEQETGKPVTISAWC